MRQKAGVWPGLAWPGPGRYNLLYVRCSLCAGRHSNDVKEVLKEVSTLKSTADCPFGFHRFADDKSQANYSLTKALYPYHLCCRIIPPKISQSYPVTYLNIYFNRSSHYRSFKVFLADQLTASFYDLHKRTMLGEDLVSDDHQWMIGIIK